MRRPKKKKATTNALPKLEHGKLYRVQNYHTGNFAGICTETDRWSARLRVSDPKLSGLEVGSMIDVSLRLATFVEELF